MVDFKDKVAVITGGAQGIGRCMTRQMIYHGDNGWKLKVLSK
jgi:NAD(P)-dependent dehydrogenase (short-subunit alcohol dehydrogenase family)